MALPRVPCGSRAHSRSRGDSRGRPQPPPSAPPGPGARPRRGAGGRREEGARRGERRRPAPPAACPRARPPRRDPFRRTKDLRWELAQRRDLKWRRRARPRPFRGRHRDGAGGAASPRRRSVRERSPGSLVRAGRRCRGMADEGDSEPGKVMEGGGSGEGRGGE